MSTKKNLIVLSGAGISAESGVQTFRDTDGLWEGHNVEDVATPQGFAKNPELVLKFYNERRAQLKTVFPNKAHLILAALETDFNVKIITQNVDNLHEKAGSTTVKHLHGELLKVRSTKNENEILDWETDLNLGDFDSKGNQLRPHIVWFGEQVPALQDAIAMIENADFVIVIGTSLQVYPAASLMHYAPEHAPVFYIDPKPATVANPPQNFKIIATTGTKGMEIVKNQLLELINPKNN
jgi:NAD-dependent deacetylase